MLMGITKFSLIQPFTEFVLAKAVFFGKKIYPYFEFSESFTLTD